MSAFGIVDIQAYVGLPRSDDRNPAYVSIWWAFAECKPESSRLKYRFTLICCFTLTKTISKMNIIKTEFKGADH